MNLICDLTTRAFPGRVLRVRYEDLCVQPTEELQRIGRAFGLDLTELHRKAAGQEPLAVGHNIGGNHLRRADVVRFDPGVGRGEPALPRWLSAVTFLLCGALMFRYGYRLRSDVLPANGTSASLRS